MSNLGALFYPKGTEEKPVAFESLFIPYIYKEIYLEGLYLDIFNQKPLRSMTIMDVGANIGVVTQYMQPYAKTLYSIEPSTEHFEALSKNVEFNGWDNVKPFKMAISDTDGEADLHLFDANHTCHSIVNQYAKGETEKVKTQTFETFFKENNIEQIDFCKFDVEGAEDTILRSNSFKNIASKIKAIEIEFHYPTYPELVKLMIDLGFSARRYESSAIVILFVR